MSNFSFDVAELKTHATAMDSLASEVTATAQTADGINLGDASYGPLVGPMALVAGRALIEGYGALINGMADNFAASGEQIGKTVGVYETVEQANAQAGSTMAGPQ